MTGTHGWTAAGFEGVRDAFEANFASGQEAGAAFSAYHRGRKVVDLWGGVADEGTGAPWEEDTLVLVFSTTKGVTAMAANQLLERRLIELAAPVATYWPEFAANGKESITVEHLLSHRAGLEWIDDGDGLSLDDVAAWDPVVRALARQAPRYPAGTRHGYHALTYGWLVGEVLRRVAATTVGGYVSEHFAEPLDLDLWIGLPDTEQGRVAQLVVWDGGFGADLDPANPIMRMLAPFIGEDGVLTRALSANLAVFDDPEIWNSPAVRAAEIPAGGMVCDARSLARLYAACVGEVDGIRVLGPDQVEDAATQRTRGPDSILMNMDVQFGLGFMVRSSMIVLGGRGSFGHFGAGGSVGWADPGAELAVGYAMNKMAMGLAGDLRSARLVGACYDALR